MEQLLNQVKALSELELAQFLSGLADHIQKEKMDHLWTDAMEMDSYNEMKSALDELESDLHIKEAEISNYEDAVKLIKSAIHGL